MKAEALLVGGFLGVGIACSVLLVAVGDAREDVRDLKAEVVELREELHGGFDCTHEGQRGECRTGGGK